MAPIPKASMERSVYAVTKMMYGWTPPWARVAHQLKAVKLRHADVEQHELRRVLARMLGRLRCGAERANDVDVRIIAQQSQHPLERQRLIVHHQCRDGGVHLRDCLWGRTVAKSRSGRSRKALVPPCGSGPTVSVASSPYAARSRNSTFARPWP